MGEQKDKCSQAVYDRCLQDLYDIIRETPKKIRISEHLEYSPIEFEIFKYLPRYAFWY